MASFFPAGVFNPDALRSREDAVAFVCDFFKQHKPVAAICHGPWSLIEADVVRGRKVTLLAAPKNGSHQRGCELG